ncbi:hypothetical protein [Pseudonocardia zijingensis]|uniref:Uncharacterized protein n=1 Tax=Pseudonocardia zijingensis TaxID=153376 RepID=A0ABP3YNZ3_9PSEU
MSTPDRIVRDAAIHAAAADRSLPDDSYVVVARALRGLDPITGEPARHPRPSGVLPTPPDGDSRWSIVTLAAHLCVPPAAVDAELLPPDDGDDGGDSPDFHSARRFVTYDNAAGEDRGDCWLTHKAAERIAAALPAGLLARRVAADQPEAAALLGWDQIHALARHIVDYAGGPA